MTPHTPTARTRRDFLYRAGGGLGGIALHALLNEARAQNPGAHAPGSPLAARKPHFEPKAKRVIFIFAVGGPSQLDLFDRKPELERRAGQPLPESVGRIRSQFTTGNEVILPSTRRWQRYGRAGIELSDLMPRTAACADDICFLRACWA